MPLPPALPNRGDCTAQKARRGAALIFALLLLLLPANLLAQDDDPCAAIDAADLTPSAACLAHIARRGRPAFPIIPRDDYTLDTYQLWRPARPGTPLYAEPDGAIVKRSGDGLVSFLVSETTADGRWLRNAEGLWLRAADAMRERPSEFRGALLGEAALDDSGRLPAFGWLLADRQPAPAPGAAPLDDAPIWRRYELFYVFASAEDDEGARWLLVGERQWLPAARLAQVIPPRKPRVISRERWLAVDRTQQTLIAYWRDTPQFATLVSTGLPERETPAGFYEVWARLERDPMSGFAGAPDEFALESVPWVLYYDGDYGFHGAYWHDDFGAPRSHGCVNLSVSDAAFVFRWTVAGLAAYGADGVEEIDTQVYVWDSGE